jgi:hypothetical protein
MANSYVEYSSGLTATTYSIPFNYIAITDVNVKGYNGSTWTDLTIADTDNTAKTVELSAIPSSYTKIRVWRNTSTAQLVDFQNGSRLSETDLDTAYQQGLFVAQEVSENASTEVEGIGPQGPQGIQGPAGNDGVNGANGANGADGALPNSFESSEENLIATNQYGTVSVTHTLNVVPKLFEVVIRCKTVDQGYSVDDEIKINNGQGISPFANANQVGIVVKNNIIIANKAITGDEVVTPTTANWKLVFRAFA